MTLVHGFNLPASWLSIATGDSREWAKELYENIRADAPPARVQVSNLATPAPPLPGTAPSRRRMRAEQDTARAASRDNQVRLPGPAVRALIVYFLGLPVFWFAAMDLALFFDQSRSSLGPALDAILMVFGGGLVVVSIVAWWLGTRSRTGR